MRPLPATRCCDRLLLAGWLLAFALPSQAMDVQKKGEGKPNAQAQELLRGCAPDRDGWLVRFRDSNINHLNLGQRTDNLSVDVHEAITACQQQLKQKTEQDRFSACLQRVELYTRVLARPGMALDDGAGGALSNDDYFTRYGKTGKLEVPQSLTSIFDLLDGINLRDPKQLEQVKSAVAKIDPSAIVVPYVSAGTPSLDAALEGDTYGRIIIWMQGKGMSHYVQFSANAAPGNKAHRHQASVVNYEPGVGTYAFDLDRDLQTHKFVRAKDETTGNAQKCWLCHTNGVLAIHPYAAGTDPKVEASLSKDSSWVTAMNRDFATAVLKLNQQMLRDYDVTKSVVGAPPHQLAPGVSPPLAIVGAVSSPVCDKGTKTRPAGNQAIKNLTPLVPSGLPAWQHLANAGLWAGEWITAKYWKPERYTETIEQYSCLKCHTGETLWTRAAFGTMIGKYVGGGYMPPDITQYTSNAIIVQNSGDKANRDAAAECFVDAYFGQLGGQEGALSKWMKGTTCN
jgi:hypothetical protein